jgi:hypothetical protein
MTILIIVIALGVASRTSAIDAVLRPIVAEARRRSIRQPVLSPPIRKQTPKRPTTPSRRKPQNLPTFRSFSTVIDQPRAPVQRKLAKSAHLHALPSKHEVDSVADVEESLSF